MTMPHLMNCAHLDDGWCLDCVVTLNARAEAAEDRAEAAEQKLREIAQFTLKTNTRAESAEAECERLRAQVATLRLHCASYDFLSDAKDEIWELLIAVRDSFDGSEYQQGKKDGLRSALAILGTPEMASFNRGGGMARPVPGLEGGVS